MEGKEIFLNSLSEEQTGIFYAHANKENLEEVLMDVISFSQMQLFKKWKDAEKDIQEVQSDMSGESGVPSTSETSHSHRDVDMHELMRALETRMELKLADIKKELAQPRNPEIDHSLPNETSQEEGTTQSLKRDLNNSKEKCETLEQELISARKMLDEKETESVEFKKQIDALQVSLSEENRKLDEQVNEISKLEQQLISHEEMNKEVKQLKTELSQASQKFLVSESENWQMSKKISGLEAEKQTLTVELQEKSKLIIELKKKNEELIRKSEEKQGQYSQKAKHPSINWSGELRKEIREKIKGVNLCARKDDAGPPSDVETGAFRGRQQSYSKRMNKTRTSEERNHKDKIREQIEQLKVEKKDHNLNMNSFSGLAHLDSSVVDENLEDSFEHVHHSEEQDLTTEPIDKVEVLVEEKEITSDKLNKMKEEAVERLPEETNILLLGESGVGKSTFLNAFTNYMMYNNLEQADKIGVKLLTFVNYDFYDEERNRTHICEGPNGVVQDECDEKTKEPKIHKLSSGGKIIQLLDTPGIGDEEGIDKDDENFLKIMSALKEFESISAICILMPSNESKLSTTFRYCINELLNKLHSSLKDNIFFCFTRSRLTMYRFGDTIPRLRKLLAEMKVDIPLGGSNLFSFDNECVRHLLAKKRGMEFDEFEESTQKESWEKSSISTFQLLEQIAQRNIVNLDKNRNLNEVRRFLEQSSKPLVEILKVHIMNKQLIEKKIQALENSRNYSSGPTPAILTRAPYTLEVRRLERPQMVCTSEKCTKTVQKDSIFKNEFNVCHRGCIVREPSSQVPHPELKFCREMENGSCLRCGCSWQHHMHMTEEYEVKQQNISQSAHQSKKTQKNDLEPEIRSIDLEIDTILSSCAMFSSFILKNSLTGEHDSFKDHLDQTITEMVRVTDKLKTLGISEEQIKSHKEYQLAQELTNQKLVYQEKVSSFKTQNKDVNDITEAIENLKSLSDWESVVGITEKHRNDYTEKVSKAGFIAMLSDDQFGKFLAHEGNPSCIAAMEDTLTAKQYKVIETLMKMKETATNGSNTNNPPIPRDAPTPKPKNVPATTIPETDSRIDAYAHTTEVIIPTAHGGKIVGAGGETVKRLTKDSNTKIQLNRSTYQENRF